MTDFLPEFDSRPIPAEIFENLEIWPVLAEISEKFEIWPIPAKIQKNLKTKTEI